MSLGSGIGLVPSTAQHVVVDVPAPVIEIPTQQEEGSE